MLSAVFSLVSTDRPWARDLLTAYLEDRPIYLFDEWAADQDPYFKEIFYLHLLPDLKARHKTLLVISHDDRCYPVADRVVKLDEGQVVSDTWNALGRTAPVPPQPKPQEPVSGLEFNHQNTTSSMHTVKTSQSTSSPQQEKRSTPPFASLLMWCLICLVAALAILGLKAPKATPATAPQNEFSAERALIHVRALSGAPHPTGSRANLAAREYVMAQLSGLGFNPQVATAIGIYNGSGTLIAGNTHDVVARLPGTANTGAILLMAHYDSVANGPGAADDGTGVAAILEGIRALKAELPLKNDLIVLITDGEEAGLLGAEAFVASHPWMKDIALVMNFEARGNQGPSLLFETSVNNARLIKEVAQSAPYPTGSSLFYAVYKLLPNDTDFTVFRAAHARGLNFAFGGHLEAYHSWLDTADNLDPASLQHHGSYVLSLVRHFGRMDMSTFEQQNGDAVFFDWYGSNLITYSERWVIPGEFTVTVLLALAIILGSRNGEVRMKRLLLAVLASLTILLIIPVVMAIAGWLVLKFQGGRGLVGDLPANSLLLIGLVLVGAALGGAAVGKFRKHFNPAELFLAGLVLTCILSWILALLLPAGSYLLSWPLLFTVFGFVLVRLTGRRSPRAWLLATITGAVVTILLFAPIAYLLYVFLTLNLLSIVAVGLLVGLFFNICMPVIDAAAPARPWRTIVLPLLVAATVCLGIGIMQSHPSVQHPRQDDLLYSFNADDHTAVWISPDNALDGYTSQFISATANRQPLPNYLAGSQRKVLSSPAPVLDLLPPISIIRADEQKGDIHNLLMHVQSPRDAEFIVMRFEVGVQPVSVKISGRTMSPGPNAAGLSLLLYGMGSQGADLDLTLKAPSGVSFWVGDYSVGLPTTQRRPPELIAGQGSDQTLVGRKYILKSPAK